MKQYKYGVCLDCGKKIHSTSVRCRECYLKRKQRAKAERTRRIQIMTGEITDSHVIDGHVQVCRHLKDCYYGGGNADGCSYAIEEGKSRKSQGLYIRNGKCDAYTRKDKKQRRRPLPIAPAGPKKLWEEV